MRGDKALGTFGGNPYIPLILATKSIMTFPRVPRVHKVHMGLYVLPQCLQI